MRKGLMALTVLALAGCGAAEAGRRATTAPTIAPVERPSATDRLASAVGLRKEQPAMRWGEDNPEWTEAALSALQSEGVTLLSTVPSDVMQFCPGYARQTRENRAAFWAGLVSAVAHYEGAAQGSSRGLLRLSRPQSQEGCLRRRRGRRGKPALRGADHGARGRTRRRHRGRNRGAGRPWLARGGPQLDAAAVQGEARRDRRMDPAPELLPVRRTPAISVRSGSAGCRSGRP